MATTIVRILAWLALFSTWCESSKMSTGDNTFFQKHFGLNVETLLQAGNDSESIQRARISSIASSLVSEAEAVKEASASSDVTSANDRYLYDLMSCQSGEVELRTREMSTSTYDGISLAVESLYDSLSTVCDENSCEQADFAGCVLRAAGHDFMDYDPVTSRGGSDGCVDFHDPDNMGLECLAEGEHGVSLLMAYQGFCTTVSLADFLVVSAEALMSLSRTKHGLDAIDFKGHFKFGRRTEKSCNNIALPSPEDSCPATATTFIDRMGLDWKGAAALMGVHTLGRAQSHNSGYEGHWSDPHNSRIFNNNYYVSIVSKGWMPKKSNWERTYQATKPFQSFPDSTKATRIQWARSDGATLQSGWQPAFLDSHEMMLNTDICLMFYNGLREPTKASTDECCTWVPHSRYSKVRNEVWNLPPGTVKRWLRNIKGKNGWCGTPRFPRGTNGLHKQCCSGATFRNCGNCNEGLPGKKGMNITTKHCQELPVAMNGPAEKEVLMFADNEKYWLQEFLMAWEKATENGAADLTKLMPTLSPSPAPTPHPTPAPTAPTPPLADPNCPAWCIRLKKNWVVKCKWPACSVCGTCSKS